MSILTDDVPFHASMENLGHISSFASFLEHKCNITDFKKVQTTHIYEYIKFLRCIPFKESTIMQHLGGIRAIHKDNPHYFSEEFYVPKNSEIEWL